MPVSMTKLKNAAIAAKMAALPSIPRELFDHALLAGMPSKIERPCRRSADC
jgi:hypothetical protein